MLTIFCCSFLVLPPMDFSCRNKVSVCRYRYRTGMVCCCVAHQMPISLCCACPAFPQPSPPPHLIYPSLWLKLVFASFLSSYVPPPLSHCPRHLCLSKTLNFGYFISHRIKCSIWTLDVWSVRITTVDFLSESMDHFYNLSQCDTPENIV